MKYRLMIKRVYAPESEEDGIRILTDRLWPRGESKAKADLTEWAKQIAPGSPLRMAFHHGEITYEQFRSRYLDELDHNPAASEFSEHVQELLEKSPVTLLFSSKNEAENNAAVLKEWLENRNHSENRQ